jgi:hypothetical protein
LFSRSDFLEGQAEAIENSLWSAIGYIQERIKRRPTIARPLHDEVKGKAARLYAEKAQMRACGS